MTEQRELDCNQVVELVTEYLDGSMDADVLAAFEAHLVECDGCDLYLDQIRQTIAVAGTVAADTLPEQTVDGLLRAFRTLNSR
jgi:predicted anti-sigma-YlaC factor YlaD